MNLSPINYQPKVRTNHSVNFKSKASVVTESVSRNTGATALSSLVDVGSKFKKKLLIIATSFLSLFGIKLTAKQSETNTIQSVEPSIENPDVTTNKADIVNAEKSATQVIEPKTKQKSSEEILGERVETWEELFTKAEELYQVRSNELKKEAKKTGIIKGNEYNYSYCIRDVKSKKQGKIANTSISVGIGLKLMKKYAQKFRDIQELDWQQCWDIQWDYLTNEQKYNFAKYAYESKRFKTHWNQELTGHSEWWEKDVGKQTVYHDYPFEGAQHHSENYYRQTYEIDGYGKIVEDGSARIPRLYEGKDPRPACRSLWETEQYKKNIANK